jgi:radial spoke head protein 9
MTLSDSIKIENWMHYRPPQSLKKKKKIEMESAIYEEKILDELEDDTPEGVWSINSTIDETAVIVKNLYWPGALAFHKTETNEFGYCYFGDGIKNHNLPFLI